MGRLVHLDPDQQRVGLVHAATNVVAVSCYAGALAQRAKGRSGRLLSLAGLAISSVGATLGGHLAYHQALGANHADRVGDLGPADWRPLGRVADLPDGTPVRRDAGEMSVFVLRRGTHVTVLADRCPHLSAPLSDGQVVGTDGDACVVCPWHGSEFRLDDGAVVHGPATAALPRFEVRVRDGQVQARLGSPD
ncbi:Rieske (2Fe-2S) protein [Pseudonocardia nigra]|uniref:Rieske (2Fe-2S) protein n=1 Tax=Pseudonocardia nigra TaxID=1921578 RepID=UPI001C5CFF4A|nr:Rieske (2Fe-2S) protein [Pseudonocardia nigra]